MSVWSEVQTCIWPSRCHCHSLSLASVKSRLVYLSGSGSPGQRDVKRVCVCLYAAHHDTTDQGHFPCSRHQIHRLPCFFQLGGPSNNYDSSWLAQRERVRVFYDLQARIATQQTARQTTERLRSRSRDSSLFHPDQLPSIDDRGHTDLVTTSTRDGLRRCRATPHASPS